MPKFKAKKANITAGRLYEAGEVIAFPDLPSHHWEPFVPATNEEAELEAQSMFELQLDSMSKAQIQATIQEKYGVLLNDKQRKEDMVQQALAIIQSGTGHEGGDAGPETDEEPEETEE